MLKDPNSGHRCDKKTFKTSRRGKLGTLKKPIELMVIVFVKSTDKRKTLTKFSPLLSLQSWK